MKDEKTIKAEIGKLDTLKDLVRAYEGIAAIRMKKTRNSVLRSREFIQEVRDVFDQVRSSYAREVQELAKKRGKGKEAGVTFLAHNGKTVAVWLSANTGLYGGIVPKTLRMFLEEVRKGISEVTVVGRYGLSLFLAEEPARPYTYFDLPDYGVVSDALNKIIRHIVQYEEIHVYYGRFISVVSQKPEKFSISAEIDIGTERPEIKTSYLFEPSLEKILMFFETVFFASLLDQTVREGQLAKFASRVVAMETAEKNVGESLAKLKLERQRITHRVLNRKQLNSLVSVMAK